MNISNAETGFLIIAKTCGCKNTDRKVTYFFASPAYTLCLDKKEIIMAEIEACERLFKYALEESDRSAVEKEISELRMALDLIT
jgi:hypothetical protein